MRVDLDLKRLDSFGYRLHSAINRATIGIMTASLVVGSSIVMTVAEGPTLFGDRTPPAQPRGCGVRVSS
jgi:ubiquinone biosynthesis protein